MKKKLFFTLALFWCSLVSFGYTFSYSGILYTQNGPTTVAVANHSGSFSGQAIIYNSVYDGVNWYSVTNLEVGAFQNCTGLTSVTIPNSVTSIGTFAFSNCRFLTSVNIPNSVTIIGDNAFNACSSLTSITIPNSVTSITPNTFSNCIGLTSVSLPNSVISIGNAAFLGCSGLTSLNVPNSVTTIGVSSFQLCTGLTSVTIPNSVTSIGNGAFNYCSGLTSVIIPNSVTSIGIFTFQSCTGLTSVIIPNTVTSIGTSAFKSCTGLTSLSIPNSVTSIGSNAFQNCIGLTDVTVNWATPLTNIDSLAFSGVTLANVKLYVPAGTETEYDATAVWTNFNIIIPITATQSQTDVSCNGGSNGLASVVASGGTMPYTYLWSNGSNSATATGLTTGNYSCTITDATMVSIVKNFVITEPTQLTATQSQTNVSCDGVNLGSISLTTFGGVAPYNYLWESGSTSADRTGLTEGSYSVVITDSNTCTITRNFEITQPIPTDNVTDITVCDFYIWNGTLYQQSGLYIGATNNCVTEKLNLTVYQTNSNVAYIYACDSYTWANTGQIYTTSGIYTGTTTNCVTEVLYLTIAPKTTITTNETACNSFLWSVNGLTYTQSGNYTVNFGCEYYELNLTINPYTTNTTTATACGSYTWLGSTYTASGLYNLNFNNCLIEYLDLTITPSSDNVTVATACDSYTWNGTTYNQTGIYVGTTTNCITEKLDLTITPSYYNNTTRSACDSYIWANNNQTYTQSGTYYGTTTGCGTEKLNLTITPTPIADAPANVTACQVYTLPALSPGNKYYSESNGQGIEYVVGANDGITQTSEIYVLARSPFFPFCQTQNSFTVTITPNSGTTASVNACGSYTWGVNDVTYTTSGIYEYVSGCNTSYLNLTINPITTTATNQSRCDSYYWAVSDGVYNQSGTYTYNVGCESFILNLTITPSSTNTINETACDFYTWNGQTYTTSGIYVITTNCVTDQLNLTITPSTSNTANVTAVGNYTWSSNNFNYTLPGNYSDVDGCDTQILNLTLIPATLSITNENGVLTANTNAPNATYQWYNCISEQNIAGQTSTTFTPTQSGSYNVTIRINGILSGSAGCFNFTFLANNTFSEIAGLDIYPNPSTGIFNLKLPIDLQIEIYNNLGQLLSSEKMFSGSNVINIADKAAGVYFLKANDGNNVSTFKIIKN